MQGCKTRERKGCEEENEEEKENDLEEDAVLLQTSTPERSGVCDQDVCAQDGDSMDKG